MFHILFHVMLCRSLVQTVTAKCLAYIITWFNDHQQELIEVGKKLKDKLRSYYKLFVSYHISKTIILQDSLIREIRTEVKMSQFGNRLQEA